MAVNFYKISYANTFSPKMFLDKLGIDPKQKASYQWIKIFNDKEKLKKYGFDSLSKEQKEELLDYLIENSADADIIMVPGF